MDQVCNKPECTFSQTGQCVLNNNPEDCPDRIASLTEFDSYSPVSIGESVLETPEELERLTSSLTLSLDNSQKLMREKYCKIIAILGVPGTGKTASLASLYLLLSHKKLKGFQFRDSKSLMAFEEISRGARKWDYNKLPDKLTVHTEINDERSAGYLHLRINCELEDIDVDLLLTDLPGEWTTSLIDSNRTDRLNFLRSAERIWLTVNGEEILNVATRKYTIHRLKLLIQRTAIFLGNDMPDITIVLTHCDKSTNAGELLNEILSLENGFSIKINEIASFSSNADILPGTGISEIIRDAVFQRNSTINQVAAQGASSSNERQMLNFRNRS